MENWLTGNPLPGMLLWVILYISDYYLTLASAKGYKEVGHFHFAGGIELTPQYQKEINSLTSVSPKHLTYLVVYTFFILVLWWIFADLLEMEWLYLVYLGMFLLLEVAIHMRHFRNLRAIQLIRDEGGVDGEVTYQRRFSYKLSAFDLYSFAGIYSIVAALTYSPFFLGGAFMCVGTGIKYGRYAKNAVDMPVVSASDKHADPA